MRPNAVRKLETVLGIVWRFHSWRDGTRCASDRKVGKLSGPPHLLGLGLLVRSCVPQAVLAARATAVLRPAPVRSASRGTWAGYLYPKAERGARVCKDRSIGQSREGVRRCARSPPGWRTPVVVQRGFRPYSHIGGVGRKILRFGVPAPCNLWLPVYTTTWCMGFTAWRWYSM